MFQGPARGRDEGSLADTQSGSGRAGEWSAKRRAGHLLFFVTLDLSATDSCEETNKLRTPEESTPMRATTLTAALIALALAGPAFATDFNNANAEQQTQPVPNRGDTAGGPAHDMSRSAAAGDAGRTERSGASQEHSGRSDARGHRH